MTNQRANKKEDLPIQTIDKVETIGAPTENQAGAQTRRALISTTAKDVIGSVCSVVRFLQTSLICLGLANSPAAFALQIQILKQMDLRAAGADNSQFQPIGILSAGSRVEIPDRFAVRRGGTVDLELTLNNWLRNGGSFRKDLTSSETSDKSGPEAQSKPTTGEYYFPVRITRAAPGSKIEKVNLNSPTSYLMELRNLAKVGGLLVVTENSRVYNPPADSTQPVLLNATENSTEASLEATSPCTNAGCASPLVSTASTRFEQLTAAVSTALNDVDRVAERKRKSLDHSAVARNLRRTCGLDFGDFSREIERQASREKVPAELLISMMFQESSGRCDAALGEHEGSQSLGLFQINSRGARYPKCSPEQMAQLRKVPISQMRQGPACLENPVLNLSEAIRILKGKLVALTRPSLRPTQSSQAAAQQETLSSFDESQLKDVNGQWTPEAWRLAVSAYNGGERWVMRAKHDLETFARKHGENLNPYNWDDLRVFYLRSHLNRFENGHQTFFGNNLTGRRENFARINLAYTEAIAPRGSAPKEAIE